jgi:hypothetical protein
LPFQAPPIASLFGLTLQAAERASVPGYCDTSARVISS